MKRKIAIAILAVVALFGLVACSEARAFDGEITYVIGDGSGDQATIKAVLLPGNTAGIDGDEIKHIVPGNQRNYLVGPNGDRLEALVGRAAGATEATQGPNVAAYVSLFWGLNQDVDTLKDFYRFCSKYTCYSTSNNEDRSSLANSSTEGWNVMLKNNFSPALDRAFIKLTSNHAPDELLNPSEWDKLATELGGYFQAEVGAQYSGLSTRHLFCGNFAQTREQPVNGRSREECVPPVVKIQAMNFQDPSQQAAYDKQANLDRERAINQENAQKERDSQLREAEANAKAAEAKASADAKIRAERAKANEDQYGPDWQYRAWLLEVAKSCQGCTLVFGSDGNVAIGNTPVPTK